MEKLGKPEDGTSSLKALQQLDPLDPADLHYRLARGLFAAGQLDEARREVLFALEETPRYREAQELLLAIVESRQAKTEVETAESLQVDAPKPPETESPRDLK